MKKVLFVANIPRHISAFHLGYLKEFKDRGYEVHVACNGSCELENVDKLHDIDIQRQPFSKKNIKAYIDLSKLICNEEFDIIHCHTPTASVLTRLVKRNKKIKSKIIYTAHGFHFYKSASIINWMIFYPIEKYLSRYTDILITINAEDYAIAKKKFYAKKTYKINGVGLNPQYFYSFKSKERLKEELKINNDCFILIYVAELSNRKNQTLLLRAIKELKNKNILLLLVGDGYNFLKYEKYIKENNLNDNVKLLGYRKDVYDLMNLSDVVISTSKQEGLPVNLIEAMYLAKPIIASKCRGNRDLVKDGYNGILIPLKETISLKNAILDLYDNKDKILLMGENGKKMVENYMFSNVLNEMKKIYFNTTKGDNE